MPASHHGQEMCKTHALSGDEPFSDLPEAFRWYRFTCMPAYYSALANSSSAVSSRHSVKEGGSTLVLSRWLTR